MLSLTPTKSELWTPTVLTGANILCYGDSLTAGYCSPKFTPYAESLSIELNEPIDYAGLCGWTTRDMIRKADEEVTEAFGLSYPGLRYLLQSGNYQIVLLMAGTNDLGTTNASIIAENLAKLHHMCHETGASTVAVTVPQSAFSSDYQKPGKLSLRKRQKEVNRLLEIFASEHSENCLFVEVEEKIPWIPDSPDWSYDGLHMSKCGYEKLGRILSPMIKDLISSKFSKSNS